MARALCVHDMLPALLFSQDRNTILADEMGLGKTVQCVSLVGLLAQHMNVRGPFLVVVPLSTVPNWIREFRKWVPMVSEPFKSCCRQITCCGGWLCAVAESRCFEFECTKS